MEDVYCEIVFFEGRVQGVGFRYTVAQIATEYEVAGFVSNMVDGRVYLEAEGRKEEVNGFIASIQERMHGYIRKAERNERKRPPEFSGFAVR
ncbi:MAG: acylphosphatase [Opitutaceae bacterium]|jgi:acylphosphatase